MMLRKSKCIGNHLINRPRKNFSNCQPLPHFSMLQIMEYKTVCWRCVSSVSSALSCSRSRELSDGFGEGRISMAFALHASNII